MVELLVEEPVMCQDRVGGNSVELPVVERRDRGVDGERAVAAVERDESELGDAVQCAAQRRRLNAELAGEPDDADVNRMLLAAGCCEAVKQDDGRGTEVGCPAPLEVGVVKLEPKPGHGRVGVNGGANREEIRIVHGLLGRARLALTTC